MFEAVASLLFIPTLSNTRAPHPTYCRMPPLSSSSSRRWSHSQCTRNSSGESRTRYQPLWQVLRITKPEKFPPRNRSSPDTRVALRSCGNTTTTTTITVHPAMPGFYHFRGIHSSLLSCAVSLHSVRGLLHSPSFASSSTLAKIAALAGTRLCGILRHDAASLAACLRTVRLVACSRDVVCRCIVSLHIGFCASFLFSLLSLGRLRLLTTGVLGPHCRPLWLPQYSTQHILRPTREVDTSRKPTQRFP
jgi:hypothetical protein